MAAQPIRKLLNTAARQHQVFTTEQALLAGIPHSTLRSMARRLFIIDLGHGLWAFAGAPNTYYRKLWTTKLSMSPDSMFTGRTVLWLRRIITATPREVDILTGPALHRRTRPSVHAFRGALLEDDDSINLEGLPTAPVYRAFTDAAGVSAVDALVRWLPAMDRRRLGTLDGLAQYMELRARFVGVVNLRAAIATLSSDLPHSGAERAGRRALRGAGLRPYPRPYPVRMRRRIIAEIDIAYPKYLYGAEVDGPHHLLPEVAAADKARDRQLVRLGWTVDRFPHELVLNDPVAFVREVRSGLNGAQSRHLAISHR